MRISSRNHRFAIAPSALVAALVLWAAKAHDPGAEAADGDDDGGSRRDKLPLWPRRGGPHSGPGGSIDCPDGRRRQAVRGIRSRERLRSRDISRR